MQVFVERGFSKATTADIARAAQVSKRELYRLFVDKTEIFTETVHARKHLILALPRPAGESLHGTEALKVIFRLNLTDTAANERDALLNLVARESLLLPELNALLYDSQILNSRELVIDWLLREIASGHWPACNVKQTAGLLMDVVFGALLPHRLRRNGGIDRVKQAEDILERLEIVLAGLRTPPPAGP